MLRPPALDVSSHVRHHIACASCNCTWLVIADNAQCISCRELSDQQRLHASRFVSDQTCRGLREAFVGTMGQVVEILDRCGCAAFARLSLYCRCARVHITCAAFAWLLDRQRVLVGAVVDDCKLEGTAAAPHSSGEACRRHAQHALALSAHRDARLHHNCVLSALLCARTSSPAIYGVSITGSVIWGLAAGNILAELTVWYRAQGIKAPDRFRQQLFVLGVPLLMIAPEKVALRPSGPASRAALAPDVESTASDIRGNPLTNFFESPPPPPRHEPFHA